MLLNEDLNELPKNIRFSTWERINESQQVQAFRYRMRLYQISDIQNQLKTTKEERDQLLKEAETLTKELKNYKDNQLHLEKELQYQKNENGRLSSVLMSPGKVNRTISNYMYDLLTEIGAVISVNFGQNEIKLLEGDNIEENVRRVLESISNAASFHRSREQEVMQLQERLSQSEEELSQMHVYLEELFEEYKNLKDKYATNESMEGIIQHSREIQQQHENQANVSKNTDTTSQKKVVSNISDIKSPNLKQQSKSNVETKRRSRNFWEYTPIRLFTKE